ncbi:MAG: Fic family protein [Parachlamydiaceae bacterium]|nr:Fic family protein [Parachlamydiaceae bacterium]
MITKVNLCNTNNSSRFFPLEINAKKNSGINFKVIAYGLLLLVTPVSAAQKRKDSPDLFPPRYLGGREITEMSGSSKSLSAEYGPHYSSQMACHNLTLNTLNSCSIEEQQNVWSSYNATIHSPTPDFILPYIDAAKNLYPLNASPKTSFPENLEAFRANEVFLTGNGNRGCYLSDLRDLKKCRKMSNNMASIIKDQGYEKLAYSDDAFHSQGFIFGLPNDDGLTSQRILLGINPKLTENYKKALEKMTQLVLRNPCFFGKDPSSIVSFLKDIHSILLNKISAPDFLVGEFRSQEVTVFHDGDMDHSKEGMLKYLKEHGATSKEITTFKNSINKVTKNSFLNKHVSEYLSNEELNIWKKLAFLPIKANKVPQFMDKFAINLKNLIDQDIHPVALAAWAHCELVGIHPFGDANGRSARLLMNTLLVRGGYEPVIIPDDEAYTLALNANREKSGKFSEYLVKLIKEQTIKPFPLIRI